MSNANVLNRLISIIEATLKLPPDKIDIDVHLETMGINSLIMMELIENIDAEFGLALTPVLFVDVETLSDLATLVDGLLPRADAAPDMLGFINRKYAVDLSHLGLASVDAMADALLADHTGELLRHYGIGVADAPAAPARSQDVAIVGISCRLPDAPDARAFWDNLLNEKNSAREIPASRWQWDQHYSDTPQPGKTVSKWGALIDGVDCFDPAFFNISAQEAAMMDPQQRLLLQEAYRAVEDAGIDMNTLAGSTTGVFVGYQYSEYEQLLRKSANQDAKQGPLFSSSSPSYYLANRVSFAFDLRGPSESFNVNCASSAVAINRAYFSLVSGESDAAVAGGVSLNLFEGDYIASSQYGLLSPDGTSGVFDNDAKGFTRGEGVAAIVLKRLEDAERDGNRIYAVIKGCHQNFRGAARSQSEVKHESITAAIDACSVNAGIDPATVRYVEVDGYATKWADSFEYEGVKNAFKGGRQGEKHCALGSLKGNIGNVEAASGVSNVIKLALSLHHKIFPATISCKTVNTFIDIQNAAHPLYIASKAIPFADIRQAGVPVRAGINSFADSGTNVHILLEEYVANRPAAMSHADGKQLFVLSARNPGRLAACVDEYIACLSRGGDGDFGSMVYTAQMGRAAMDERLAIVAASRAELIEKLTLVKQAGLRAPLGLEAKDIFRGSAGQGDKHPVASLITAEMALAPLTQAIQTRQWKPVALLWVNGVAMPWEVVWRGQSMRPVSLPGYSFARERYWIDSVAAPVADLPVHAAAAQSDHAAETGPMDRTQTIALFLRQEVARQLGRRVEQIAVDTNLIELGMSSVGIAELIARTDSLLACHLSPSEVFKHPDIAQLSAYLAHTYPDSARPMPARAPSEILIAIQGKGEREPIFAMPGAGGNALSLQQLSHALGNDQPFYCLEPVGLDGRLAPMTSVEEIAELNIERLKSVQARGPYRLLGYSNGGVVAFEMARQLLARKEKVASLILLDSLCPTARGGQAIEDMVVAVFKNFATSLGGHVELDVQTLKRIPEGERSDYLYDSLVMLGHELPREQFVATFNVATASEHACRAYQPVPLGQKVDVVLLKAMDGFKGVPNDYGWGEFVPGTVRTFPLKGDHFSLIEKGSVQELARKINALGGKAGKAGKSTAVDELEVSV
ncbi:beta-ketoacyl synthase N-terminal-like domain-containing protein [Massilia scottii]|uniref:beta-ketoacyl synthase N-terminal-like domain-containing protein n=1 Tax=Massilia scottii TaxID=3057166 RepID=UPI004043AC3E